MERVATIELVESETQTTLNAAGDWTARHCNEVAQLLATIAPQQATIVLDLSMIRHLDTVGAILIRRTAARFQCSGGTVQFIHNTQSSELLALVARHSSGEIALEAPRSGLIRMLGEQTHCLVQDMGSMLAFFGETFAAICRLTPHPGQYRWRELMFHMNESAIKALWIIALTMFLVGIVVAYQSAVQLKAYGANIFIVDMLGIGIMRELGPMLAAIIVAGRSGSAFTAQIGVMKITEELDAMRTMGFDPFALLVIPRMMALVIMMPFLIFFADFFGILSGMVVASTELGLPASLFVERFAESVAINHFIVGVVKGPFFAILIASIGIYRGMQVKSDTESIGINTTRSVVEAIFAVIICDAIFSVIFTNLGF